MSAETQKVLEALAQVADPVMHIPLTSLEMIRDIQVQHKQVSLTVELTTSSYPHRQKVQEQIQSILQGLGYTPHHIHIIEKTNAQTSPAGKKHSLAKPAQAEQAAQETEKPPLSNIKHIILVASGKGGVGKSTVAVNLAAALALSGASVGLLDADIYGPSVPIMLGLDGKGQPEMIKEGDEQRIIPMHAHGIEAISMGFFVPPDVAMAWRGPMVHSALLQFMREVAWSDLDYMVMDLPPGTGDIQMTLAQRVKVAGSVIVTTPQLVALADVIRAKAFFDKLRVPIFGVVENMSYFMGDDGKKYDIFGSGGGAHAAERFELPLLAEIPLAPEVRIQSDDGTPVVISHPNHAVSKAFMGLAQTLREKLPV